MKKEDFIRSIDLLSDLSVDLYGLFELEKIEEGSIISFDGDLSDMVYILAAGTVKSYKHDSSNNYVHLCNYSPGIFLNDFFSEKAVFNSSMEALEECYILKTSVSNFFDYAVNFNPHGFVNALNLKNSILNKAININLKYDAIGKVSYAIYSDLVRFNKLKRSCIASELNISPETLSRSLKKLSQFKAIEINHSEVIILNEEALCGFFA